MEFTRNKTLEKLKYDLVRDNLIKYEDLETAEQVAKAQNINVGQVLINSGIIQEEKLLKFLESKLHIPYVNLEDYSLDKKCLSYINFNNAQKYKVIPLFEIEGILTVAMSDPLDLFAIDKIVEDAKCEIEPVISSESAVIKKIEEYNIADDKPVLLLPGRITRWKGQHILIHALHLMKNQNYYCIIAGDSQGRQEYLEYLKKLAHKYKLEGRIGFFGRYTDAPALMINATVILSTAIEPEAFGRISVEGQAMGKIVVASNIGGTLDTIIDGKTGKLYQYDNPQALADALDWALSLSPEEAKKISQAGIKNVKEHFTKQIMCDKTIEVYREVVNQKEK